MSLKPRKRGELYYSSCAVPRTKLVRHATLNIITGETTALDAGTWVTEPCGTPLFSNDRENNGVCRSCASGWTHHNNFRVEGPVEAPTYRVG